MPSLSWNETRDRSIAFAREWKDAAHEEQQKHLFWTGFFECFGLPLKNVAVFERAVENLKGHYSFLDLFWPGVLLVEHKSRGAPLDKAGSQAFAYLADLAREGRHDQLPRYVILCDFTRFILYDLEPEEQQDLPLFDDGKAYRIVEFTLPELHRHVREFAFIRGEKPARLSRGEQLRPRVTARRAPRRRAARRSRCGQVSCSLPGVRRSSSRPFSAAFLHDASRRRTECPPTSDRSRPSRLGPRRFLSGR